MVSQATTKGESKKRKKYKGFLSLYSFVLLSFPLLKLEKEIEEDVVKVHHQPRPKRGIQTHQTSKQTISCIPKSKEKNEDVILFRLTSSQRESEQS